MPEVHILFEGYYLPGPPVRAVATTTLVTGPGFAWVVDPGTAPAAALLAALSSRGLDPSGIDIVFLTHSHMDHLRNAGLFGEARVLDSWGWWEADVWREFDGVLPPGLSILATPGHSADLLTLLVETPDGVVAVCGDVTYSESLLHAEDPFAEDPAQVNESRKLILARASIIVPGHGAPFRTRP